MEYPAEIALTETIKSPDDDDNDEDALRRYDSDGVLHKCSALW